MTPCPVCNGKGYGVDETVLVGPRRFICPHCYGLGVVPDDDPDDDEGEAA